jgi:hypothetical protein
MTDIDLLLTEIDHLKSQLLRERQISGAAREHHLRNLKIKDAEIGRLRKSFGRFGRDRIFTTIVRNAKTSSQCLTFATSPSPSNRTNERIKTASCFAEAR